MYPQLPTSFTAFQIPEDEVLEGSKFTNLQECVMRNRLAALAEERLEHETDPSDLKTVLQEAYLKGQLSMLQLLLEESNAAKEAENNPTI